VGSDDKELMRIAGEMNLLNSTVCIKPAIDYAGVANEMKQSSALLLFSRFENLPCVILEALCCGLPVISSRVGGIEEVIDETNGILVENENVPQLVDAMQQMMDQYAIYNKMAIAEKASGQFNYAAVGGQYFSIYQHVLNLL